MPERPFPLFHKRSPVSPQFIDERINAAPDSFRVSGFDADFLFRDAESVIFAGEFPALQGSDRKAAFRQFCQKRPEYAIDGFQ